MLPHVSISIGYDFEIRPLELCRFKLTFLTLLRLCLCLCHSLCRSNKQDAGAALALRLTRESKMEALVRRRERKDEDGSDDEESQAVAEETEEAPAQQYRRAFYDVSEAEELLPTRDLIPGESCT